MYISIFSSFSEAILLFNVYMICRGTKYALLSIIESKAAKIFYFILQAITRKKRKDDYFNISIFGQVY